MYSISKRLKIYCDNTSSVRFSNNDKSSSAAKHFQIKYLATKEKVRDGLVFIEQISTKLMIADPMTKALPAKAYNDHVREMGLVVLCSLAYFCVHN